MTARLIVRAEVPEADCKAFDHWYETEHLPDALAAFKAESAERGWSDLDPNVHIAIYHFASIEQARAIAASDEIAALIREFDRVWQGRVNRTREVVAIRQTL